VEKPDWFTGEAMIEEGPVELRRSGGTRELGESGEGRPTASFLAVHTVWGVAEARKEDQ